MAGPKTQAPGAAFEPGQRRVAGLTSGAMAPTADSICCYHTPGPAVWSRRGHCNHAVDRLWIVCRVVFAEG